MVWCTYCGQEFTRAEHLDRHVITHAEVKPYKCSACHFSFNRRFESSSTTSLNPLVTDDLLQKHLVLVHKDLEDCSAYFTAITMQRRLIACAACARAKTKCDKIMPDCSRCISKGLICQARSTRRTNDVAHRQAKRTLGLYRSKSDSAGSSPSGDSSSGTSAPVRPRTTPVPIQPNPTKRQAQQTSLEVMYPADERLYSQSPRLNRYSDVSTPSDARPFPSPGTDSATLHSGVMLDPEFFFDPPNADPTPGFPQTDYYRPYLFSDLLLPDCSPEPLAIPYQLTSFIPHEKDSDGSTFDPPRSLYSMQQPQESEICMGLELESYRPHDFGDEFGDPPDLGVRSESVAAFWGT